VSRFRDRAEAGRQLAGLLQEYAGRDDVVVLALPRGGVPVASEVARALGAPLDVLVVRKLGVPGQEELAMGAIASGGAIVLDDSTIRALKIGDDELRRTVAAEERELERRESAYRSGRERPSVEGKAVVLIDDGLATGATMRAAVRAVQGRRPAKVVVAVPVAARQTRAELERLVDEVVCAVTPPSFRAVGVWYENFSQVADDDVRELLETT
jgi:putative phosphoribosyl transferase